jgi:GntR family transcriptional regulator, rspAB operon transcriptional repressor
MTALTPTDLDPRQQVAPQIYRLLRDRIVLGQLHPGDALSEAEVARSFGVSRQPVREAFIKLSHYHLIEVRPQRGTYVRRISVSAVLSAQFVREAVEADIVRLVSSRPDTALLSELDALIAAQRAVAAEARADAFLALDEAFHRRLAAAAGQSVAWETIDDLRSQMNRVRHMSFQSLPMGLLVEQHATIVSAIRTGESDQAEAAMRGHLRRILRDLPTIMAENPDCFEDDCATARPVTRWKAQFSLRHGSSSRDQTE